MNKNEINMLRPRRLHGWQEINNETEDLKPPAKRSFLTFLIPGIVVILILSVFSLARSLSLNKMNSNDITLQPKNSGLFGIIKNFIFKPDFVMEGQKEDRINILLLGIGGENHDGGYLSDTNIILSIQPSQNSVAMISIPRDMTAKIDSYGWTKINHAHAYGEMKKKGYGGEYARQIFEKTLNIEIPYFAVVDFTAFKEIIDIIGGVEIEIPTSFTDYSYPTYNYGYQIVSFKQGKELMNGERALIYARSRHGNNNEGSDFARAKRQQLVIASAKEKILSADTYLNPLKIKKILDSLTSHINTNLELNHLVYLAGLARDVNSNQMKTLVLDNSANGFLKNVIGDNGAYLLAPRTGDYSEISSAIENIFNTTSTASITAIRASSSTSDSFLPSAKIEIQNGTWKIGFASRTEQQLKDNGFAVYTIGNTTYRPVASSSLHVLNKTIDSGFIQALERITGISSTTSLPVWNEVKSTSTIDIDSQPYEENEILNTTPSATTTKFQKFDDNTDILLILGDDYK